MGTRPGSPHRGGRCLARGHVLRAVGRRGVNGERLGALGAQTGRLGHRLDDRFGRVTLVEGVADGVRVLMARAALGGVIPSACSCARNASSVELALAVPAKPSAARPKVAAVKVVPTMEAAKRRVNIDDLLVLMSSEVALVCVPSESAPGLDRFSINPWQYRYRFDGVPTVQGEWSAMAVPERVRRMRQHGTCTRRTGSPATRHAGALVLTPTNLRARPRSQLCGRPRGWRRSHCCSHA